jgi:hypothetical protein
LTRSSEPSCLISYLGTNGVHRLTSGRGVHGPEQGRQLRRDTLVLDFGQFGRSLVDPFSETRNVLQLLGDTIEEAIVRAKLQATEQLDTLLVGHFESLF